MLLNPVVPLCPVTVKDKVVVAEDWLVVMLTLDNCVLVMFPLIDKSMVEPLFVVAWIVEVDVGVGDGVGVEVGVGVAVDAGVGVGLGVGEGLDALTVIVLLTPEWPLPSEPVIVIEPTEDKVIEPFQTPAVNEPDVEGLTDPRLALKDTELAKVVTVFPKASLAVIVTLNELPAVAELGTERAK